MAEHKIAILNRIAVADAGIELVCNNPTDTIRFEFDDEWSGIVAKTARFSWEGKYIDVPFSGNVVEVPEIYRTNYVFVGAYADNIASTPAKVKCRYSIKCLGGKNSPPSEDIYNQILEIVNRGVWPTIAIKETNDEITVTVTDVNGSNTVSMPNPQKALEVAENAIEKVNAFSGAGAHNSIYRGKNLGSSVTAAQYAAIQAGTFDDLYIGDYWVIGDVAYRIAAFDYYYRTGDVECTAHHVTLVPDGNMYEFNMNETDTTIGAYVGSKMYTEGLETAKETINTAFGSAHVLNHRQYLKDAVTDGYESYGTWYDSTVELMTEQNVYGCKIYGNCLSGTVRPANYTIDKTQYPLFRFRPDMISNRQISWLRDVATDVAFAIIYANGDATATDAHFFRGVRPAFSIVG